MKDWLKRNKLTPFTFGVYLVIFLISAFFIGNSLIDKKSVKNDYKVTIGWIVEVKDFGIGPNRYLTYSYTVNGKLYTREIDGPNGDFSECKDDISLCKNKRFLVIYSPGNPKRSLIDLTREIQNIKNPELPEKLTMFQ